MIEIDKLQNYLQAAENFLSHSKEQWLLKNEDAIADIACGIMNADITFNGKGSIRGWRYQNAVWAKKEFLKRHKKNNSCGIKFYEPTNSVITPKNRKSIHNNIYKEEFDQDLAEDLRYRIESLPYLQRECVRKYYLEYESTFTISKELNLSRSLVYIHIQKGLENLRKVYVQKSII